MRIGILIAAILCSSLFSIVWAQSSSQSHRSGKLFIDGSEFRIGLQITDRFMIGGQLPSEFSGQSNSLREGFGVFSRYYFSGSNNRLRPYAQIGFELDPFDHFDPSTDLTAGLEYRLKPGIFFNNEISNTIYLDKASNFADQSIWELRGYLASRPGNGSTQSAFTKGDLIVGSQLYEINITGSTTDLDNYLFARLQPNVSYALSDRWLLNGQLDVSFSSFNLENGRQTNIDADIYAGIRYILSPKSKIKPYLSAGVRYQFDYVERPDQPFLSGGTFSDHLVRPELGAGILFPVGKNTVLDLHLGIGPNLHSGNGWGINGKLDLRFRF
ncbi:MAG: hypothetical protein AAGF87_02120 [Bacteroidota bacterium]